MAQHVSLLQWGAGIGIALILGSCEAPTRASETTTAGVSALQFDDIPIPDGLELRDDYGQSDSRIVGEYRYANFVYSGTMAVDDVSTYLRERMPQHSWQLAAEETATRRHVLRFQRGIYTAECVVSRSEEAATRLTVTYRTHLDQGN